MGQDNLTAYVGYKNHNGWQGGKYSHSLNIGIGRSFIPILYLFTGRIVPYKFLLFFTMCSRVGLVIHMSQMLEIQMGINLGR